MVLLWWSSDHGHDMMGVDPLLCCVRCSYLSCMEVACSPVLLCIVSSSVIPTWTSSSSQHCILFDFLCVFYVMYIHDAPHALHPALTIGMVYVQHLLDPPHPRHHPISAHTRPDCPQISRSDLPDQWHALISLMV